MKVLKFGGTSIGKAELISQVSEIIRTQSAGDSTLWVVFSAFAGVTDTLIKVARLAGQKDRSYRDILQQIRERHADYTNALFTTDERPAMEAKTTALFDELEEILHGVFLLRELTQRSQDYIVSFGERLSTRIISAYANLHDLPNTLVDSRDLIITDDEFGAARVDFAATRRKFHNFAQSDGLFIITGFIGATANGVTTTLGRGGSDFTASIIANVLNATEIQIWTDVNGVLTANPSTVPSAFSLTGISYEEAMELSHFGAKVLHSPTIQPALEKGIPIRILNTFQPDFEGTTIRTETNALEYPIKGITSIENIALLTLQGSGMVGVPGIASRLFGSLARENISIVLITQASSEHSICIAVTSAAAARSKQIIEAEFDLEIEAHRIDPVVIEDKTVIIAIVGENMRKTPGISGRLFRALGDHRINVIAIAQGSSELNISLVVSQADKERALNVIHDAFFRNGKRTAHLFLAGTGLIGSELLRQIQANHDTIARRTGIDLRVIGIGNEDNMLFAAEGIALEHYRQRLSASAQKMDMDAFLDNIEQYRVRDSVFVDCTASPEIATRYESLFNYQVHVVAANKIANAAPYSDYTQLHSCAQTNRVRFLYETNVGAGLPVIRAIRDLVKTGDRVIKIEAMLSGTTGYLLSNYNAEKPFAEIVRNAQKMGFTEPDPRIDLRGLDVARKLLIIIRESGVIFEMENIAVEPLVPENLLEANSLNDFYQNLESNEDHFQKLLEDAKSKNCILRYVASYAENSATVAIRQTDSKHPFYSVGGCDNMVVIYTRNYRQNPLVIRGPGAGAEVTAAGVLADILYTIENE